MTKAQETSERLNDIIYNMIKISFDSDGKIMTRKDLKPMVSLIKNFVLNYSMERLKEKNVSTLELQDVIELSIAETLKY